MTQLSKAAAREKYLYNKKYQDRYWEKKAAEKQTGVQTPDIPKLEVVSISRSGMTDEQYISALEKSNKTLNSENRRLVRLLHDYQTMISKSIAAAQ